MIIHHYSSSSNFSVANFSSKALPTDLKRFSFKTLNDNCFASDGNVFFKFDGSTFSMVGLPPPLGILAPPSTGFSGPFLVVTNAVAGNEAVGVGATGSYSFYGSWVNFRGFESQVLATLN